MKKHNLSNLMFDDFKRLAKDQSLSKYERIGFPDEYRKDKEEIIFADISSKLSNLDQDGKVVLDIGPGCSDLPLILIDLCRTRGHQLHLVDSAEMLSLLPTDSFIHKNDALFPNCPELIESLRERVDIMLCYSVLQYVFLETSLFRFLDFSLSMLAPGGQMLIGDIPNISKRKRFFSSKNGIQFHQQFMNTEELPIIEFNKIEENQIDDAVIFSLLQRARAQGFDAYVLPQNCNLPMANRREDILFLRP